MVESPTGHYGLGKIRDVETYFRGMQPFANGRLIFLYSNEIKNCSSKDVFISTPMNIRDGATVADLLSQGKTSKV